MKILSILPLLLIGVSSIAVEKRQTSGCDAIKCAKTTLKDAAVGAFCIALNTARAIGGGGTGTGTICSIGVTTGTGPDCKDCKGDVACALDDVKARGKACGPGNLAELGPGNCVQVGSSVPNPDPNTDIVDGDYVIHCANGPKLPSGSTTDGGTCIWDCSQCQQCIDAGKTIRSFIRVIHRDRGIDNDGWPGI